MIERKCEITPPDGDLLRSLVNTMLAKKPRIREIRESDLDAIADLLTRGFVHRNRDYWGARPAAPGHAGPRPPDTPCYGYVLDNEGTSAGCLLTIYSSKIIDGEAAICCKRVELVCRSGVPQLCGVVRLDDPEAQGRDLSQRHAGDADLADPRSAGFCALLPRAVFSRCRHYRDAGRGITVERVSADTSSVPGPCGRRPRNADASRGIWLP